MTNSQPPESGEACLDEGKAHGKELVMEHIVVGDVLLTHADPEFRYATFQVRRPVMLCNEPETANVLVYFRQHRSSTVLSSRGLVQCLRKALQVSSETTPCSQSMPYQDCCRRLCNGLYSRTCLQHCLWCWHSLQVSPRMFLQP